MSDVLHRRELSITITSEESAVELVQSSADLQAKFFLSMTKDVNRWPDRSTVQQPLPSWAMQCRSIANEMNSRERVSVANMLDTLIDHLREVRECESREVVAE